MERATRAIIDLNAIASNVAAVRNIIGPGRDLMAIVKADAYGHGAFEVSRTALNSGATCLGVALPEEGENLRSHGIDVPLLVLGLIHPDEVFKVVRARLEQTLCTLETAEALDQAARASSQKINVHIKVDTGMGRIGISPNDALDFLRRIRRFKNLHLKGIFSHLPCADEPDSPFTRSQITLFRDMLREIEASGIRIPQKHLANSAGILNFPESYFDLVRPGIMIYGLHPSPHMGHGVALKPAMTLKTKIAFVKQLPPGTPISYGHTFSCPREMLVATLPIGYGDGYNRGLSNGGYAMIRNVPAPLIGRVCMDMCMFDVTDIKDVQPGDEAVLFGNTPTVDELAHQLDTINYEIVCSIGKRVPRIYVT
ncbi:MAG: alanine racemase [Deltaproteobacteria bacterium]|nr:alanine racemase [Deltaproteobacteria bacterium]